MTGLLDDPSVGSRLVLVFGTVLAIMTALTAVGISRMSFIQGHLERIVEEDATERRPVNEMRDVVRHQSVTIRDVVMQADFSFKKSGMKRMKEATAGYRAAAEKPATRLHGKPDRRTLADVAAREARAKSAVDAALEAALSDDHAGAAALIRDKVRPAQLEPVAALEALLRQVVDGSKAPAAEAAATCRNALTLMLSLGVLAVAAGAVTAPLIRRSVALPLRQAVQVAQRVADGDLTQSIDSSSCDEVGHAIAQMDEATQQNAALVEETAAAADSLGHQAPSLVEAVSIFKVDASPGHAGFARGIEDRPGARVRPACRPPRRRVVDAAPARRSRAGRRAARGRREGEVGGGNGGGPVELASAPRAGLRPARPPRGVKESGGATFPREPMLLPSVGAA